MADEDLRADLDPFGILRFGLFRELPSLASSCQFLCHAAGVRIILFRTVRVFLLLYHLHIQVMRTLVQSAADLSGRICGSTLVTTEVCTVIYIYRVCVRHISLRCQLPSLYRVK